MNIDKAIDTCTTTINDVDQANKNARNSKPQIKAKSVIAGEVEKFKEMSKDWWSAAGEASILNTMNQIRVPYVVEKAKETGIIREEFAETTTPLKGLKILDVGCGGGFYAEALARLGADVVGIDVTEEMIVEAKAHQDLDKTLTNLEYKLISIEEFALDNAEAFDVLVCSEVAEHVNDPRSFVLECTKCLKFGGSMIMQTVNKTPLAKWILIYFVEYIWRIIPTGSHEYEMFITPEDMSDMLAVGDCKTTEVLGMAMNPFTKNWFWIKNTQALYSIHATKTKN